MTTPSADPADRATLWAGRALTVIGVGHLAVVTPSAVRRGHARSWFSGALRRDPRDRTPARSELAFWQGPGSLGVPLAVVGAVVVRLAHAGVAVPRPVTAVLGAWIALGSALLEPSGFPLGVVPVGLLVRAERLRAPT